MTAVPLFPPAVAVIVTGPPLTRPVTRPVLLTPDTAVALLVQVKLCPERVLPLASLATADSWTVPRGEMVAEPGETVTDATDGWLTVPPEERLKLHSDIVPVPDIAAQSASDVAPLCSLRTAS